MLSFFPRDVLDEIWDIIGSVSEGFLPTFSTANHENDVYSYEVAYDFFARMIFGTPNRGDLCVRSTPTRKHRTKFKATFSSNTHRKII